MEQSGFRFWTWVNRLFKITVILLVVGVGLVVVEGYELPGFSPVLDPSHSAQPSVDGVDRIHLEQDTLHVHVNNQSDYDAVRVIAPDGAVYDFPATRVYVSDRSVNRPGGWPTGNYTVLDVDESVSGGVTIYNNDTVYLEPES